jgi:hypothetical protein
MRSNVALGNGFSETPFSNVALRRIGKFFRVFPPKGERFFAFLNLRLSEFLGRIYPIKGFIGEGQGK